MAAKKPWLAVLKVIAMSQATWKLIGTVAALYGYTYGELIAELFGEVFSNVFCRLR